MPVPAPATPINPLTLRTVSASFDVGLHSSPTTLRVLACCDIAGCFYHLDEILQDRLHRGEPVDIVFAFGKCDGTDMPMYAGPDASRRLSAPLYFIDSHAEAHIQDFELSGACTPSQLETSNVFFLGSCGAITFHLPLRPGLRIAFLSGTCGGTWDSEAGGAKYMGANYTAR